RRLEAVPPEQVRARLAVHQPDARDVKAAFEDQAVQVPGAQSRDHHPENAQPVDEHARRSPGQTPVRACHLRPPPSPWSARRETAALNAVRLRSESPGPETMARKQAPDYEQRREAIVDAAAALFARRGFLGASVADLAEACGASKSLIYHYYPS